MRSDWVLSQNRLMGMDLSKAERCSRILFGGERFFKGGAICSLSTCTSKIDFRSVDALVYFEDSNGHLLTNDFLISVFDIIKKPKAYKAANLQPIFLP